MRSPHRLEDWISLAGSFLLCLLSILCHAINKLYSLHIELSARNTAWMEDRGGWHVMSGWLGCWFAMLWLLVNAGGNSLNGNMVAGWSQVMIVVSCDRCYCVKYNSWIKLRLVEWESIHDNLVHSVNLSICVWQFLKLGDELVLHPN